MKKIILSFLVIMLILLIFPFIIVNFADARSSMGWLIILFFCINPIMSVVFGILSGTEIRKLWWIPLLISILFPLLYWVVLQEIVLDLFAYSIGYLIIGIIAMIITSLLNRK